MDLSQAGKIMRSKTSTPEERKEAARVMGKTGGKLSHASDDTRRLKALQKINQANSLLIQQQEMEIKRLKETAWTQSNNPDLHFGKGKVVDSPSTAKKINDSGEFKSKLLE